jgi:HAD superfamily hydrolase (TIGR01509 family)
MKPETTAYAERCTPANAAPGALQAVIFDVDGTLADTEPEGHRVAFNRAFDEFGIDWFWSHEVYGELLKITGGKERIRAYAATHAPELYGRIDLDTWIARLHALKSEIYSTMMLSGRIPLRPGIARLIQDLRKAGIRLAIATTTTPSSLNSLVVAHFGRDMTTLFDVIGAGDVVPHKKPAPDIYQWVLQQLELPASACLVIEDSLPGVAAATAAGLPTIVTVSGYTRSDRFADALAVLSDCGEPDAPMRQLAGVAAESAHVTVAQLQAWHRAAQPRLQSNHASPQHPSQFHRSPVNKPVFNR